MRPGIWTLLDRKRREYVRPNQWLTVYVRFGLATSMFGYGFAKIIPTRMQRPTLEWLVEPWDEFSPMGVLCSFMGFPLNRLAVARHLVPLFSTRRAMAIAAALARLLVGYTIYNDVQFALTYCHVRPPAGAA